MDKLLAEAKLASNNATAPRSGVHVGCAIELGDGTVYTGWNIEGPWQTSLHAEVSAISRIRRTDIYKVSKVAIYAEDVDFTPCGACLDWLMMFSTVDTILITSDGIDEKIYVVNELYPHYPSQ